MSDYCIRATAADGQLRCWAASTTDLCEEARKRHDTYPTATAALGRVLTAGVMMGLNLKGEDLLTIRVNGDGPLGSIVVTANARGTVRGYVQNPHTHLPSKAPGKLDVGGAVGKNGLLYVTKDLGLKEPYTGSSPLVSGEIAEDLTRYFAESEQTPSAVALGVLVETDNSVRAGGGYMVQLMPGATDEVVSLLEENIGSVPPVSQMIAVGLTPEEVAARVLKGMDFSVLDKSKVEFQCNCSRERLEWVLKGIGKDDLASLMEQGEAEITCHFCNEKYHFSKEDLERIVKEVKKDKKE
ncbi:MAG: Hsp33 family molecular chaperone HslO [Bacillota bacterium]|jgi:molecular chaperone Hsp33